MQLFQANTRMIVWRPRQFVPKKAELNRYVLLLCLHHENDSDFNKRHMGGIMSSIKSLLLGEMLKNMLILESVGGSDY